MVSDFKSFAWIVYVLNTLIKKAQVSEIVGVITT